MNLVSIQRELLLAYSASIQIYLLHFFHYPLQNFISKQSSHFDLKNLKFSFGGVLMHHNLGFNYDQTN